MQTYQQPRLRKTPFGDLPAPNASRYVRSTFIAPGQPEALERPPYEIFSLRPAIDGLGNAEANRRAGA
jgi:hypothetical protein